MQSWAMGKECGNKKYSILHNKQEETKFAVLQVPMPLENIRYLRKLTTWELGLSLVTLQKVHL